MSAQLRSAIATLEALRGTWSRHGEGFVDAVERVLKTLTVAVPGPELPDLVMKNTEQLAQCSIENWMHADLEIFRVILELYAATDGSDDSAGALVPQGAPSSRPTARPDRRAMKVLGTLSDYPAIGSVVGKLLADSAHPLSLTTALTDQNRQAATASLIRQLAAHETLGDAALVDWIAAHPGVGPLFEPTAPNVGHHADGTTRKNRFSAEVARVDPARRVGITADGHKMIQLSEYAARLETDVLPVAQAETAALAARFPGARWRVRTKGTTGILEKVRRMTAGSVGRNARQEFTAAHVFDAVGGRIVAADVDQLGEIFVAIKEQFGTGDGGRLLGIENTYVSPKRHKPAYRAIHVDIVCEAEGLPYVYEMQLMTWRASLAADLDHNALYKPFIDATALERQAVLDVLDEAAAMDQADTRRRE